MSKIHQITHPIQLIAEKVNFFADYFEYISQSIGITEDIDINNHLSLIEKILWQIESNLHKSIPYIDNYLSHPYLQKDDPLIIKFHKHKILFTLFNQYKSLTKQSAKIKWITENPDFIIKLKSFQKSLKRNLAKKALSEIISFLGCIHELKKHQSELIYSTKILISEFLINGHSRKDLGKVFDKIISRDFKFPFPKKLTSDKEREEFLAKRTFNQQFEGILNLLQSKPRQDYFIFRIFNIDPVKDFEFKYNQVCFYNPLHLKLKQIRKTNNALPRFYNGFFKKRNCIIAVVQLSYNSLDIAENLAISNISSELSYLNNCLSSNGYLEKYTYLKSPDLKVNTGRWGSQEHHTVMANYNIKILRNNPYIFLSKIRGQPKNHFLKYEKLYTSATTNRNIEDYWQYLEAIIPPTSNGEKQVIEVVSSLLLLKAEIPFQSAIADTIRELIAPYATRAEAIGLSPEQQQRYFKEEQTKRKINFNRLKKESNHAFLNHLLDERERKWSKENFIKAKEYYKRILYEAYSQRNAIVHKGEVYNKSLVSVNYALPWIINRFRWSIFYGLRQKKYDSFSELLKGLKIEADALITSNQDAHFLYEQNAEIKK